MRKHYFFAIVMSMASGSVLAQTEKTYDFVETMFSITTKDHSLTEEYPVMGVMEHVSANGEYAVGYDYSGGIPGNGSSFLWKRSEPEKIFSISDTYDRVSACDVSNDGIIVGSFELRPNSDTEGVAFPGWKHVDDVAWTPLPVPDQYSIRFARSYSFAEEARAITPDGGTIAGNLHFRNGEKEVLGSIVDITITPLTVWTKSGDGYALSKCYTDLGKSGNNFVYDAEQGQFVDTGKDVNYETFLVHDISNDGKTVVGMNVSWRGGFNPAFMRDGKLYQIFSCGEEGEAEEEANFNGGPILAIDANGNMYGYYTDLNGETKYFIFTAEGKLEYASDMPVCADKNGNKFGVNDKGLYPVTDCSEDGKVVVGAGVGSSPFGAYNYPKLVVSDEASGIESATGTAGEKVNVKLDFDGNTIRIKGNWLYANVYTASGTVVTGGNRGASFNIGNFPSGTYIVKVATADGVKSFKLAK